MSNFGLHKVLAKITPSSLYTIERSKLQKKCEKMSYDMHGNTK